MKIGYIVGEVNTQYFMFVTDTNKSPPRLEYIVVPGVVEKIGDKVKQVNILAQVTKLKNLSDVIRSELSLSELEVILERYSHPPKVYGEAKILGYLEKDGTKKIVQIPRCAALPGQTVYIADDDILEEFFTQDMKLGIQVGSLISRPSVKVNLDPNGLRRHLAIIAQTGAGKSYMSGIMFEQLLKLGGTIIVFDQNSDYVCMRNQHNTHIKNDFADRIEIYRPPGVKGRRYSDTEIGGSEDFTVRFSQLDVEDIAIFTGIPSNATRIRDVIDQAIKSLSGNNYTPQQLFEKLEDMAFADGDWAKDARNSLKYLKSLLKLKLWGFKDIPISKLIKPKQLSVIDLAGMPRYVSEFVVDKTLRELWTLATSGNLPNPVFVVMEEAHNFVPKEGRSLSKKTINQIASEGRKFGIFLIVITQRPGKVDENTLSQCNSQIIMKLTNPTDQQAVRNASEAMSQDLFEDLPGLNVGEAIIVGELTRVPVMVKVGGRISAEGGSDIDLVKSLEIARNTSEVDRIVEEKTKIEDIENIEPMEAEY